MLVCSDEDVGCAEMLGGRNSVNSETNTDYFGNPLRGSAWQQLY